MTVTGANPWAAAADFFDPPEGHWKPQPKQALATELAGEVDELLYGGAAGGGKTEWLIEYMAEQCEMFPGNRVAIFRRVFPSLNRTIIPRAKLKLWTRAKWNGQEKTFTFPNGSVLELGSLQYADDVYDYQGVEYGCIGFEEITEFLQDQVDFLIGRLRSTIPGVRPHLVATTNPGGVGHRWVKRRWVKPLKDDVEEGEAIPVPGEKWRPAATEEIPRPPMRVFVPAKLEDNPALVKADPGYRDRLLRNANRAKRLALSEGDWDAIDQIEGALWSWDDLEGGRVREGVLDRVGGTIRRVIGVDPSDGDEDGDGFGVSHCALGMDGVGYVLGSWEWRATPRKMAEKTIALYEEVGADAIVIEKNHGGKWMLEVFKQVDEFANVRVVWASDNKRTRAEPVAALFEHDPHALYPYRARMVGIHEELEDELTGTEFGPGLVSPNRLDSMVWALTDLMLGQRKARARTTTDRRLDGRR